MSNPKPSAAALNLDHVLASEEALVRFADLARHVAKPSQTYFPHDITLDGPSGARNSIELGYGKPGETPEALMARVNADRAKERQKARARYLRYARELLAALSQAGTA